MSTVSITFVFVQKIFTSTLLLLYLTDIVYGYWEMRVLSYMTKIYGKIWCWTLKSVTASLMRVKIRFYLKLS